MHTQESGKGMKKLRNNKIRKLLAFMVALALMVSCMPSAYTISASEAFGDGTEDIFTDGEFTSEPAAEESTPDVSSADQEETEQAQQSTLTYENDSVKVTAEALEDGALPQNTALKADSVNENSSVSYDTVSQKLSAAATDKGSSLRGFFAYDVYFADGDGNRVEPNGRVRVTFEYKTPAAPELTDAASTSVTVEKLHYNSSTGDTDVNTLQANEDLKVLNVNEGKQIQTLQVETGNAAVFAVMWDSPETADVEAEAVSGNGDEVSIASEELTEGVDISDEPEQDAAETPAAENPEVTPEAEPSEEPAENPDAEPTEAPAEDPDVVEEPAEDIESPEDVPAADENGETSLIEVLGDDTNLRVSPSVEAEVLATVNAGTQLTLLDTVTAEDGATWYKVSWEGTEAYIRSDMAQVVDSSDEAEEVEDVLESEEVSYSKTIGDVVVTATAASGVLPKDAQFVVNPIEKGSDQYTDVADRLEKKAENEEYSIAGFLAYDIYFQDSEGNKINPEDGKVKVSMEYQNATAPDEVKEADAATMAMASADENSQDDTEAAEQNLSVSVMHFVEDANGNVESVVDMTKDDTANVETNAEGEVQKAEFETESFSTFTITWKRTGLGAFDFTKNIQMVKLSGNSSYTDLSATVSTGKLTLETEDTNPVLYLDTVTSTGINKNLYSIQENDGQAYRFQGAYIATEQDNRYTKVSEEKIAILTGRLENSKKVMKYKRSKDTNYQKLESGQCVIFVYSNAALTSKAMLYSEDGTALSTTRDTSNSNSVNLSNLGSSVLHVDKEQRDSSVPGEAYTWKWSWKDKTYTYKYAVVGSGAEATEVKYLRKGDAGGLQYSKDGETWNDVGSQTIKFIYGISSGDGDYYDYRSIETADTRGLIDIDLYNYNERKEYEGLRFDDTDYTGSNKVTSEIVKSNLGKDGYPVLSTNNVSLNKLFNGEWNQTIAGAKGLNHLFSYNSNTGEYSYNSDTNYAYYNKSDANSEKNFIVYNKPDYHDAEGKGSSGSFMPFSSLRDRTKKNMFAFGMKVSFNFMQPKEGRINGKDMIFSFSGDDDVWVFVDGKLVLDLGGVHERASGTINFNTGVVTVNDSNNTNLNTIFGNKFSDYSTHTLAFFYLERGRGDANCSLKFNLPPVPTNSIEVAKELGNSDKEKYTSTDFKFKAYLQDEDDKTGKQFNAIPTGTTFKVKKNGALTGETRVVGDHNTFSLKAGESAVFEGISSGLLFYAEEVGIESDQFDDVDVNGWNVTYYDENGKKITETTSGKVPEGRTYIAKSETKKAGDVAQVTFRNNCSIKNLRKLQITKQMTDGQTTTDTFSFKVYLSGQDGNLIPYDGSYVIKRADNSNEQGEQGRATSEGIISGVGVGDTIVIEKILSGTKFKVEECPLNSKYAAPTKTVTDCETSKNVLGNSGADGQFNLNEDARVTVTNTLKTNFTVTKQWSGDPSGTTHDSIYVGLYKTDGSPTKLSAELNADNHFTHTFNDVNGDWVAYELRTVKEGEKAQFTINEIGYVKIANNDYAKVNATYSRKTRATDYKVTYGEVTKSNNTVSQIITNTKVETQISIVKIKKGDASTTLRDAEFSLYLANGENDSYTKDDLVQRGIKTDEDGKTTIKNLTPGTYLLVETKAPTGYLLSEKPWKIVVDLDGTVKVTYDGKTVNKTDGNYQIENAELYSLPNSGGPGTYGFTISGVAILATALLLFINNKRREEEAKRS
jgi:fibro-slime domain-containing protein